MPTKFILVLVAVFLGSMGITSLLATRGYINSSLFQKDDFSKANSDDQDQSLRPSVQDFELTDASGAKTKFSSFRGQVVILSFWASWCGPCLTELPTFSEIEKKYHKKGLRVVPVNVDEGEQGKVFAGEFWKKRGFTFPSFFDFTKSLSAQFQVDMLPSNFVIDRLGRLVFSGFGANDWTSPETVEFIEGLLKEPESASDSAEG